MLPTKTKSKSIRLKSAFGRALTRFKAQREARRNAARIGFIIDATGSREATWEQAQTIQARMFSTLTGTNMMALRLVHFGGGLVTDHGWKSNAREIAKLMAKTRCDYGVTRINASLALFAEDETDRQASALILVGDSFEEDETETIEIAKVLAAQGIKIYSFLERDNDLAHDVFLRLADITNGKFAKFGDDLPLSDLCEGVALLISGGKDAAKQIKNEKVRLLLTGPSIT